MQSDVGSFAIDRYVDLFDAEFGELVTGETPDAPNPMTALWIFIRQRPRPEVVLGGNAYGDEVPLFVPSEPPGDLLRAWFEQEEKFDGYLARFDLDDDATQVAEDLLDSILGRELVLLSGRLAARLQTAGILLDPDFRGGLLIDDEIHEEPAGFTDQARSGLAELPTHAADQLRAALYADPARGAWLD